MRSVVMLTTLGPTSFTTRTVVFCRRKGSLASAGNAEIPSASADECNADSHKQSQTLLRGSKIRTPSPRRFHAPSPEPHPAHFRVGRRARRPADFAARPPGRRAALGLHAAGSGAERIAPVTAIPAAPAAAIAVALAGCDSSLGDDRNAVAGRLRDSPHAEVGARVRLRERLKDRGELRAIHFRRRLRESRRGGGRRFRS